MTNILKRLDKIGGEEMRLKLAFQLSSKKFPKNYRELILSYLKSALTHYENGCYFEKFYGKCIQKSYSFAARLPKCQFNENHILLEENCFDLFLSFSNPSDSVTLYNAVNQQRYEPYPLPFENSCTLVNISMEKEHNITGNEIICQLAMPLIIKVHKRDTNMDRFVIFSDNDFEEELFKIVSAQVEYSGMDKSLLEGFNCEPLRCKKAVVSYKNGYLTGTLGIIRLTGCPELLQMLYEMGIGSKRSSGFGYINIIR